MTVKDHIKIVENTPIVIYYDMEKISAEDVLPLTQRYDGRKIIHVHKVNVEWIDNITANVEVIDSERSPSFRNQLMSCLDRFFIQYDKAPVLNSIFTYHRANLWEVARYELFYSIYELFHIGWVIETLLHRFPNTQLIWMNPNNRNNEDIISFSTESRDIAKTIRNKMIDQILRDGTLQKKQLSRYSWKDLLKEIRGSLRGLLRSFSLNKRLAMNSREEKKKVLFIENFPNSSKISASVAAIINKFPKGEAIFVATRNSVEHAVNDKVKAIPIESPIPWVVWIDIIFRQSLVALFLFITHRKNSIALTDNDGYINFLLNSKLKTVMGKSLLRATLYVGLCNSLKNHFRPDALATTSVNGIFSRAAVLLARQDKIPTIFLQHGLMFYEKYETYILQDYAVVWGEYFKNKLISSGALQSDRVFVCGSPKFDGLVLSAKEKETNTLNKGDILQVTYFPSRIGGSTVSTEVSKKMLEIVIEAVQAISNAELTIKVKAEDPNLILSKYEASGIILNRSTNAIDVLMKSDIVIVSTSTVGMEACALSKPLIVLSIKGVQVSSVYSEYNAALTASSVEELQTCILELVENKYVRSQIKEAQTKLTNDLFDGCKGNAAERMARSVFEIIGS